MQQIVVDVVSDVVCPWCYLGKARVELAVAEVQDEVGVDVNWRPYRLNPEHPATRGTTVNPDIFFQCREACNEKVASIPEAVEHYMAEISKLTGREYKLFNYYGAPDAERVIVLMGSAAETAKEAIDHLTARGEKVGMLNVSKAISAAKLRFF